MVDAIVALLSGLAGGFAGGMLGVGGGAIYVPAMVILLDVDQHSAQGASLLAIVPTALMGSIVHLRNENVNLPVVGQVVPLAILAGFVAGFIANSLDTLTLQRIFGVVMAYLAISTIVGALRRDPALEGQQGG
jgi:hypothetical protein